MPNNAKSGQKLSRSEKTLDSVGEKNRRQILRFSWKILSRRLGLLVSILVVQCRTRTLYLHQTPSGRNTSVSSRCSGLWDRFWTCFHPQSAYETLEMCIHTRSLTLKSSSGVGFCREILSSMIENGQIRFLRRKSSARVTETPQK